MYLNIVFSDGSPTVNLSLKGPDNTLQVVSGGGVTGYVAAAYDLSSVSVATVEPNDPPEAPAAAEPEPVLTVDPAAGTTPTPAPAPEPVPAPAEPETPPVAETAPDQAPGEASQATPDPVAEQPVTDDSPADPATTEAAPEAATPEVDPGDVTPPDAPAPPTEAVAAFVSSAQDVVASPSTTDDEKKEHLTEALADVETAIAQWPDSEALIDAKAQLEQLAAELEPPAASAAPSA